MKIKVKCLKCDCKPFTHDSDEPFECVRCGSRGWFKVIEDQAGRRFLAGMRTLESGELSYGDEG